jgi:large exoprotein involved in heme utilization and adhesion
VGNAGNVRIRARSLSVTNGAQASVSSLGFGDAGTLEVNAGSIFLDNEGAISAELGGFGFFPGGQIPSPLPPQTVGVRQGGGIEIATQQLVVRGGARISTATFTKATGGNITINANALVLLESSDIIANAIRGRGGNIEIDTQGLFRCEDCQISASSNLGLDGVVEISTLDPDTSLEVLDVPEQLAKPEDVVALACSATQGQAKNEFTITGRGGLPPRPSEALSSEALVSFESPEPSAGSPSHSGGTLEEPEASDLPPPAQGWYVSDRGTVVLATQVPTATPHDSGLTSANCHAH